MTTIVITGHTNQNENASDIYQLTIDGVDYSYEVWATDNSSGADFYQDGVVVESPFELADDGDVLDEVIERFNVAYYPLWNTQVVPVIEAITAKVIAIVNDGVSCTGCHAPIMREHPLNPWVNSVGDAYCTTDDGNEDRHIPAIREA